jgi:hypothetical protein
MKAWICLPLIALVLAGCAGKTAYRESCGTELDAAWRELDLAKAEGFAGTVSYSKALSLLTGASSSSRPIRAVPRRLKKPASTSKSHAPVANL